MRLYSFSDVDLLNNDLAEQIKNILLEAVALRGQAYMVVSGGKSPIGLFKILAQKKVPWEQVTITLADERCISIENPESNERLVKDYLLQNEAKRAQFISLYSESIDQEINLPTTESLIDSLPAFDVVILGMGEDGHTASLFPCSDELESGLDNNARALLLVNPKTAKYQRISLSKRRLLNSQIIFLYLIGSKKCDVFNQAMVESDPRVLPISAFLNDKNANVQVMYAPQ